MTEGLITIPNAARRLGLNAKTLYEERKVSNTVAGVPVAVVNGRYYVSAQLIDDVLTGTTA